MNALRCFAVALVAVAAPAFAKDASRTQLITLPNPAKAGQAVLLQAEVDGRRGGASGMVSFSDGSVFLGLAKLARAGAGQATLALGDRHSCALSAAGGVKCWGENSAGQIGDGSITERQTPITVSGLAGGAVAVATGNTHSCALTSAGAVRCWGGNGWGQLGNGTWADHPTPLYVSGLSHDVVAITAGSSHTCVVTRAGAAKCWGRNEHGQLGDGTTRDRSLPTPVLRLTPVVRARARLSTRSLAIGTHALQASFPGDASHTASSGSQSHSIVP